MRRKIIYIILIILWSAALFYLGRYSVHLQTGAVDKLIVTGAEISGEESNVIVDESEISNSLSFEIGDKLQSAINSVNKIGQITVEVRDSNDSVFSSFIMVVDPTFDQKEFQKNVPILDNDGGTYTLTAKFTNLSGEELYSKTTEITNDTESIKLD